MSLARRIFLSCLVLALFAIIPAAVLGAAHGTDRPVKGTATETSVIDLTTGGFTATGSALITHSGRLTYTATGHLTVTGINPITFSFTGTQTFVAANGDELFATFTGSGGYISATTTEFTSNSTITGGTGRFADATGTSTATGSGVLISATATTHIVQNTITITTGTISY